MKARRTRFLTLSVLISTGMLLLTAIVSIKASSDAGPDLPGTPLSAGIKGMRSSTNGLEFVLTTPPFEETAAGNIMVSGLEQQIQEPGAPAIPYFAKFVALPPGADVTVHVEETDVAVAPVSLIQSVPQPAILSDRLFHKLTNESALDPFGPDLLSQPPALEVKPDPAIYGRDAAYPDSAFVLSEPMYFRDMRLVELRLYPLTYNPVQGTLRQARELQVTMSFTAPQWSGLKPAPTSSDAYQESLSSVVLNYEEAKAWRSLSPALLNAQATSMPVGTDVYKIEVDQDGVYEVSAAELAAAGMIINSVDPATVEMMHRGQPVAYQFIGDSDSTLELGESFRFFGWAFEGPRAEKQFVKENVFWLWSGGTSTSVASMANDSGMGYPLVTEFKESITREPENHFFTTLTKWDGFPNEPDAWFWDFAVLTPTMGPVTRTYAITLPNPAASGPDADYIVEISPGLDNQAPAPPHLVRTFINTNPSFGSAAWFGLTNVSITNSVPITALTDGVNTVDVVYATNAFFDLFYLNRITVDYARQLVAVGDQLLFGDDAGGPREFHVANMSEGSSGNALVWDVTDPLNPVQIDLSPGDILGSGGSFTYTLGIAQSVSGARYLVTTLSNLKTSAQISQYVPPSLDPAGGQAEWLAISHQDFLADASRLASHRTDPDFGDLTTHVVDIADVINQYGYGLPLPQAIRDYLAYALANWAQAPSYVVLIGDSTVNPKHLDCPTESQGGRCTVWDKDEQNYLITDLVFEDRFSGLIPTDHTFVLLSGNDLLADMSIGRLPVQTAADASAVVDKIILYEQNQFTPQSWQQNFLFVADNTDTGGNFCDANQTTGGTVPDGLIQTHLCLDPTGPISNTSVLTPLMSAAINGTGISVLDYRGHGSITDWAAEDILTASTTGFWSNSGKPVVLLSADCLDAFTAWPGEQSLGEVFLRLDGRGTAAHWSSSGFGFTGEHTVLHTGFFEGVFDQDLASIGNAINYAKARYDSGGFDESELYSFFLLGDPAMRLLRPDVALSKQAVPSSAHPGDQIRFTLTLSNGGIYPALAVVTDTIPTPLSYVSTVASVPVTVTTAGNDVTIELQSTLAFGSVETITITAAIPPTYVGTAVNQAVAVNSGINLSGALTLTDTATVDISDIAVTGLTAANDSPTSLGNATAFTATILTGTNVSYTWDFGDGNSGSGAIASHTYSSPGAYTAIVTATNTTNTVWTTTNVNVAAPLVGLAATSDSPTSLGSATTFTATLTSGSSPSFVWDFGDGNSGSGSVTSHTYASPGVYTAVVTATNPVSTLTTNTVVTVAAPISGLSASNNSPTALGSSTTFIATVTSGTSPAYAWDFGDGNIGSGSVATHVYASEGVYTATVTASNAVSVQTATTVATVSSTIDVNVYLPIVVKP